MEPVVTFSQVISSLTPEDRSVALGLHEAALALGYAPKIAAVGKKPDDWKCEYVAAKPKRTLCILRVSGRKFSLRAKLAHLADYLDVLERCTERCLSSMLASSKRCGGHGGCAGPVAFQLGGVEYSICRHSFLFENILPGDVEGIRRLLTREAEITANA